MTPKYRVRYTEYERGWGSRPEGFKDFDSQEEAVAYTSTYNKTHNSQASVPDWYMIAEDPVFVDAEVTKG